MKNIGLFLDGKEIKGSSKNEIPDLSQVTGHTCAHKCANCWPAWPDTTTEKEELRVAIEGKGV